jgi:MFS family permease
MFLKTRLALMFFVQYFSMGAFYPIASAYFKNTLGFSGAQTGVIMSMIAVSAFVFPFVGAIIADRLVCKERLLAISQILSSGLMLLLYHQRGFWPVLLCYLAYNIIHGPGMGLGMAIAFHHLPDGRRGIGKVRWVGTLGWVVAGWVFSLFWLSRSEAGGGRLPHALLLSAATSLLLGLYSLTLPRSELDGPLNRRLFPVEALAVFRSPQAIALSVLLFLHSVTVYMYYLGLGPYLKTMRVSESALMPLMGIGQITEIFAMLALGGLLARFGLYRLLVLGMLFNVWRYSAFAWDGSLVVVVSGVMCHGFAFAFGSLVCTMHIDGLCGRSERAGVHQFLSLISVGFGSLVGNVLGGRLMDWVSDPVGNVDYTLYWLAPAALSVVSLLIALVLVPICFRKEPKPGAPAPDNVL